MFRERILGHVCSDQEVASLGISTQFHLLKANKSKALMLVMVLGFNMSNVDDEMNFVFSDQDLNQFRVRKAFKIL